MSHPHAHHHVPQSLTRRALFRDLGRAGLAIVVVGGCSDSAGDAQPTATAGRATSTTGATTAPTSAVPTTPTTAPTTTPTTAAPTTIAATTATPTSTIAAGRLPWSPILMPQTAAFVLVRDGEAVLVDTGLPGSIGAFDAVFHEIGIGWDAVGNVIVTHGHPDHAGGAAEISGLVPDAAIHIGEADAAALGELASGVPNFARDGDRIFDLDVIATPGHTAGHLSVLDQASGVLVAGDALNNRSGLASASADTRFTADGAEADRSVRKLAGFDYDVVFLAHGESLLSGGSAAVATLADDLGV